MIDDETLLARRLAFAVGLYLPPDWARVRDSHSPYEWMLQKLAQIADPIGPERDDMRAGAVVAQIAELLGRGDVAAAAGDAARFYLRRNQPQADDRVLTPEEAEAERAKR